MLILPLACRSCGFRVDITSEQGLSNCPQCGGKMGPGGLPREETDADRVKAAPDGEIVALGHWVEELIADPTANFPATAPEGCGIDFWCKK